MVISPSNPARSLVILAVRAAPSAPGVTAHFSTVQPEVRVFANALACSAAEPPLTPGFGVLKPGWSAPGAGGSPVPFCAYAGVAKRSMNWKERGAAGRAAGRSDATLGP